MAGHSKWANIKHTKEAADKKRGKVFSKLSRDIRVAVKTSGDGDPETNPMLRVIIDKAKAANMPKDKIEAAINKALGITDDGEIMYENTYEAYAPGGVAMLIDTETDNTNRTLTELKTAIQKPGGKMVPAGSISWMFEEIGKITVEMLEFQVAEEIILELMEYEGIMDIKEHENELIIVTQKDFFNSVNSAIAKNHPHLLIKNLELIKRGKKENLSNSDKDLSEFLASVEDLNDVVSVWTNQA